MALLLGIDLGTTYFKVGLFDEHGTLAGLGRVATDPVVPGPGRCVLPSEIFWERLRRALAEALTQAGVSAGAIAGISYSSQANTFVLLDDRDVPLTPLILWTDVRGGAVPERLRSFSRTEEFQRKVGFSEISAEAAVSKWDWFLQHDPALAGRTRWLMTISDYLAFGLTGERVGDASTASMLGIYHLREQGWWTEALEAFGLQREKLVRTLRPGAYCGQTVARAATLLGVPAGIPFAAGGLDHHIAAVAAGLGRFADVSISTGTVLAATGVVDRVEPIPECYHGPHVDGSRYFRLAFDPAGAGQLDDYQRRFAPDQSIEQLISLAATAAPRKQPGGAIVYAAGDRDRGADVRYLLEKIARAQRELVRKVSGGQVVRMISATGGGARSAAWLGISADILDVPIVTLACGERACLGAAVLAATAAGIYPNIGEATKAMVHRDRVLMPRARPVANS
ncbi:MAG: FGGY-family carbohydrate kinase [Lacunisphaera sp.]|nr:FGGY-family carbohydrate kinase [Lacunisphaera sp.]